MSARFLKNMWQCHRFSPDEPDFRSPKDLAGRKGRWLTSVRSWAPKKKLNYWYQNGSNISVCIRNRRQITTIETNSSEREDRYKPQRCGIRWEKQSKVGSLPLSQWRRFSCSFPFRDFGTFSLASGQNDKDSFTVSEVTRLELLVRHLEICTDQSVQRPSCLHIRMKSGRQLRKNRADESLCLNLA